MKMKCMYVMKMQVSQVKGNYHFNPTINKNFHIDPFLYLCNIYIPLVYLINIYKLKCLCIYIYQSIFIPKNGVKITELRV